MPETPIGEEVLDVHDIQGNVLAGFRKDCQRFLFFTMDRTPGGLTGFRRWLRALSPHVSSVAEVHAFNQLYRMMRGRAGHDPHGLAATWLNIAFSAGALRVLTSDADVDRFTDAAFKAGLADTASLLNDPVDAHGNPIGWKIGGRGNEADVLVMVASDEPAQLTARVARIHTTIADARRAHGAAPLTLIWEQPGNVLPPPFVWTAAV